MFFSARDYFYSALFPQSCLICDQQPALISGGNACAACWEKTEIFDGTETTCKKCGKPVSATSVAHQKCWQCDGHFYTKAGSAGIYSNALQAAIVGLKTQPHISKKVAALLYDAFKRNEFQSSTLIVPVPLSKQRILERGFNQAEVISERLGKISRLRMDSLSLVRTKHSPIHRAGMDQKARDLSVKDSFAVVRPKLIEGQKILLVDDVLTTGATVSYCAKALKNAGAKDVNVLTVARAV